MDNKQTLSTIIVAYNCLDVLKACLESIKKYNDIADRLEVIIVDNSTTREIQNWVEQGNVDAAYIRNENKGFGQANNVGVKAAKGDILLFINPDTELTEPVFDYALQRFEKEKKLGILGFKLVNGKNTYTPSMAMRFHYGLLKGITNTVLTRLNIYIPSIMCTSGADIFIRHTLFNEIGGFDENLFMYCEEADIANRVNAKGYKNLYDTSKRIIHREAGSSEGMARRYLQRMKASKYYCEKYGIDFEKEKNKEKRYCIFKSKFFALIGKKEKSMEYDTIVRES